MNKRILYEFGEDRKVLLFLVALDLPESYLAEVQVPREVYEAVYKLNRRVSNTVKYQNAELTSPT